MKPTETQIKARRAYDLLERKRAERDPLVRAILDRFPGAEIVEVRLDSEGDAR